MNYIYQFIFWGLIIVWFSYIASKLWTKAAALFYALPIQFTIHVVLLYLQNKDKNEIFILSKNSIISLLIIILFLLIYSFALSRLSFMLATIVSYIIFIIFVLLYIIYFFD